MTARWAVAVCIPARDEAATIGDCIRSVEVSSREVSVQLALTVVADRCTDGTAEAARSALAGVGRVVETGLGNVGAARRIGTAHALAALDPRHRATRTWILATDADSVVPSGWIGTHLRLADAGAHAVAGLVAVESFEDHPPSVETAFRHRYDVGPDGGHRHVHGTNLGVRADAYRRAGGWRDHPTGEDRDLWTRLRASGAVVVSTVEAPVRTSGRAFGRAPDGFAALLRSLGTEDADGAAR